MSLFFRNDYAETCHPAVLAALNEVTGHRYIGYGMDTVTAEVAQMIRAFALAPEAAVYFLAGGTVTNMLAISALLRPHEAVIAAASGHINVHETGAVEASGHKILTVATADGKLRPLDLDMILQSNQGPGMVKPRMVYISNSTEVGTVYKRTELALLSAFCREQQLLLFLDGARLGQGLYAGEDALTLADVAAFCDLFYLGATKNGALCGEALVICRPELQHDMPWLIKNRGAMLAKGFVPALQFRRLMARPDGERAENFTDTLYYDLAAQARKQGLQLAKLFKDRGYSLAYPAESNQVFARLPLSLRDKLIEQGVSIEVEAETADEAVCRFVTSYTSTDAEIAELGALLSGLQNRGENNDRN